MANKKKIEERLKAQQAAEKTVAIG